LPFFREVDVFLISLPGRQWPRLILVSATANFSPVTCGTVQGGLNGGGDGGGGTGGGGGDGGTLSQSPSSGYRMTAPQSRF
jgi:hypothetical protein